MEKSVLVNNQQIIIGTQERWEAMSRYLRLLHVPALAYMIPRLLLFEMRIFQFEVKLSEKVNVATHGQFG